jgi:choline dehydrogenase-like flavoprotein
MLNEANMAYSTCIRCKTCDGFPCLVHAKSDAEIVAVRPALEFPNVTLMRNAKAVKLETNAAGTAVTEVIAEVEGERDVFRGDVVILSCGALNTAKLLLMSANDRHPNGLANGSGQVGRNYMFHNSQAVLAISLEPNPTIFQKTLALNDFYFGMEGFEYPMGNIQMLGKSFGPMYRGEKPLETALLPMGLLDNLADHAVDF